MDPNATLRDMRAETDLAVKAELAMGLIGWLCKGGFAPLGESRIELKNECRDILQAKAQEYDHESAD